MNVATGDAGGPPLRSRWSRLAPATRQALVVGGIAVVVATVAGVLLGRVMAGPAQVEGVGIVERDLVPLTVDADGLWTTGSSQLPAIADQLSALRRGDPATVGEHADAWHDAYDAILRQLVGVEVAATVRPVQRQFVYGVVLSRDAVDLLVEAADEADPAVRRQLSSEALRLRTRSEQVTQSARASLADLSGRPTTGVSIPSTLPTFAELR